MFLHIFVADVTLNCSTRLIAKQCVGLKLSVLNEDDLTEYSIFTSQEKSNHLLKFQQSIQLPISDSLRLRSRHDERAERERLLSKGSLTEHTILFRLRFTLYAIYGTNNNQRTVCLGFGILPTNLNDETVSKTIVLQESEKSINNRLQGEQSVQTIGKLHITLFYHSSSINFGGYQSFFQEGNDNDRVANTKKSVNEYSFLLSRKLRNKDPDQSVTFDGLLESRLSKDAKWYQDSRVLGKSSKKSSPPSKTFSHPPSSASIPSFLVSTTTHQSKKAPVANSDVPKLRKTHMSVGYVKNEWPEPHNKETDMEKRIFQLQLMNERKLKLIGQIAKEIEQKYSKKDSQNTACSNKIGVRSSHQKREQTEQYLQEKILRQQMKRQAQEVKSLELQLTKLRLESALSYSNQSTTDTRVHHQHIPNSTKLFENGSPGKQNSTTLFHRLVDKINREQIRNSMHKIPSKKHGKGPVDLIEQNSLQRLISTEAIKNKLNKPLKSNAMSHTTSSAIRATSPTKPIIVSPLPKRKDPHYEIPKFVKSSILDSIALKEKEKTNRKKDPLKKKVAGSLNYITALKKHRKRKEDDHNNQYPSDGQLSEENDGDRKKIIRVSVEKHPTRGITGSPGKNTLDRADFRNDADIMGYVTSSDEDMDDSNLMWSTSPLNHEKQKTDLVNFHSPYVEQRSFDTDRQHETYSYFPHDEEFSHDNIFFNNFVTSQKRSDGNPQSNTLPTNSAKENEICSRDENISIEDVDEEAQSIEEEFSNDKDSDRSDDEYYCNIDKAEKYKIPGFLHTLVMGETTLSQQIKDLSPNISSVNRFESSGSLITPHPDNDFSEDEEEIMRNHATRKNTLANVQVQNDLHTLAHYRSLIHKNVSLRVDESKPHRSEASNRDEEEQRLYLDVMNGLSDDDTVENMVHTADAVKSIDLVEKHDSLTAATSKSTHDYSNVNRDDGDPDKLYWITQMNSTTTKPSADVPLKRVVHRSSNDRIRSQLERNRQMTISLSNSSIPFHNDYCVPSNIEEVDVVPKYQLSKEARAIFTINQKKVSEDKYGDLHEGGGKILNGKYSGQLDKSSVLKQLEKNKQYSVTTSQSAKDTPVLQSLKSLSTEKFESSKSKDYDNTSALSSPGFTAIRKEWNSIAACLGDLEVTFFC